MTTQKIFLGSYQNMNEMADSTILTQMSSGSIGLYGHATGVYFLNRYGQMPSFSQALSQYPSAPGVAEFGWSSGYASGLITVKNTTNSYQKIQIGDNFSAVNGDIFSVLSNPGQPGLVAGVQTNANYYVSTSTGGYYYIPPSGTSTLLLEDNTQGESGNLPTNSITSYLGSATGITVTSSQAMQDGNSTPNSYFDGGENAPFFYLYQKNGLNPSEANVNVPSAPWSNNALNNWYSYVDDARSKGVMSVAPILSMNSLDVDYSQDFATSAYWQSARQAALYGGGIAFDTPPAFMMSFTQAWFPTFGEAPDTYIKFIESEILWANSVGIRSSMIISPFGEANKTENDFMQQTVNLVSRLTSDNSLPSQFIVENYGGPSNSFDSDLSNQNSLNSVANYLSTVSISPTNSESNLETKGQQSANLIITGAYPEISVNSQYNNKIFSDINLFSYSKNDLITVKVSVSGSGLLLYNNIGVATTPLSFSGTPTAVSAWLKNIGLQDESTQAGSGTIKINASNSSSSINTETTVRYTPPTHISLNLGVGETYNIQGQNQFVTIENSQNSNIVASTNSGVFLSGSSASVSIQNGSNVNICGSYPTLDQNGSPSMMVSSLKIQGTGTASVVGVISDLYSDSSNVSLNSYLEITSSAIVSGGIHSAYNFTMDSGSLLNGSDGKFNIYSTGSSISLNNFGASNLSGAFNSLNLSNGACNVYGSISGNSTLENVPGNISLTMNGGGSYLNILGSNAFVSSGGGYINVGQGSTVNINNLGSYGSKNSLNVNNNGGNVYISGNENIFSSVFCSFGNTSVSFGRGYTSVWADTSSSGRLDVYNFSPNSGKIVLENLASVSDLSVSYYRNDVIVSDFSSSFKLVLHSVGLSPVYIMPSVGGILVSSSNNTPAIMVGIDLK